MGADALDELIEMAADARLGPRAIGRLQQHLYGEVERRPRLLEVPEAELPLTGGKMALRLGNQIGNRILDRDRRPAGGLPPRAGAVG